MGAGTCDRGLQPTMYTHESCSPGDGPVLPDAEGPHVRHLHLVIIQEQETSLQEQRSIVMRSEASPQS